MAERRSAGEGSIYKLANGRWQGAVDLGWKDGQRIRKRVTRKTRREVVLEMRELVAKAERGQLRPERAPTLAEWLDTYVAEVAQGRVRPSTLVSYQSHIAHHLKPGLGRHRIDQLRPQHIAAFYRDRLRTLSPASVRRIHAVLRRALTVAVRWGLITTNPAIMVDPPPMSSTEPQPYSLAEARAFLTAAATDRLSARWVLALSLGLRQGEALGLQWDDIDFPRGRLQVRRALRLQPGGELALVKTKTLRSNRTLPMPGPLSSALQAHRASQADELTRAADLWRDSDLVFTTAIGTPVHPRNDYRAFQRIIKNAGLRRIRLHDLRHTAASVLLAQGVPARVVMEILGYSQISVTLNTYTHVDTSLTQEAADRMEQALWPDEE
jgi:integrase